MTEQVKQKKTRNRRSLERIIVALDANGSVKTVQYLGTVSTAVAAKQARELNKQASACGDDSKFEVWFR